MLKGAYLQLLNEKIIYGSWLFQKPETSVRWKAHTGQECVYTLTLQSTLS